MKTRQPRQLLQQSRSSCHRILSVRVLFQCLGIKPWSHILVNILVKRPRGILYLDSGEVCSH